MGQLVGEQVIAGVGAGRVFRAVEVDVVAVGERLRLDASAQAGGAAARVYAHAAEVRAEAALHGLAGAPGQNTARALAGGKSLLEGNAGGVGRVRWRPARPPAQERMGAVEL